MTQYLLVLCGIPSSGKTTLATKLLEYLSTELEVKLVSTDKWRDDTYYSDFTPEKENEVREKALAETRMHISEGLTVIHDDTNYYASMRHELYILAMESEYCFGIIHVDVPLQVATKWNNLRDRPLPEEVITRIHERFDIPGSKYAWDKPLETINPSKRKPEEMLPKIVKRMKKLEPLEFPKKAIPGYAEFYDKLTRQIVNKFLRESKNMRENSMVSEIRKEVLQLAISGNMTTDDVEQMLHMRLEELK